MEEFAGGVSGVDDDVGVVREKASGLVQPLLGMPMPAQEGEGPNSEML